MTEIFLQIPDGVKIVQKKPPALFLMPQMKGEGTLHEIITAMPPIMDARSEESIDMSQRSVQMQFQRRKLIFRMFYASEVVRVSGALKEVRGQYLDVMHIVYMPKMDDVGEIYTIPLIFQP